MTSKFAIAIAALTVAIPASAIAAETHKAVTRAEVYAVAGSVAGQSAAGLEQLTNGAASIDRSRTTVGN